jgi:hypothetical protein
MTHEEANNAVMEELKKHGLKQAVWKLARREWIAREEAEEKEKERAAIDAELHKLMAKKAELDAPAELKKEPVEEMVATAEFMAEFPCLPSFHLERGYLVLDEESDAHKDFEYELEYD